MERILLRNGIPEPMPRIEGTYLYQTLHVRGRRPLWLDRHTELLARNIQELFGLRWAPDLRRLEAEIAALLDANRHPVAGSSFVRMAFTPAGDLLLIPGAVSFYDGYALRSLRPAAAVVNYGVPYPEYPTSAREAACMLALQAAVTADNRAAEADIERAAVRTGVQAVIRCDGEGFVHVCDEAPLFAVKGKKVYTPACLCWSWRSAGSNLPVSTKFSMSITGASPRYRPAKGNSTPQSSPNVSPAS